MLGSEHKFNNHAPQRTHKNMFQNNYLSKIGIITVPPSLCSIPHGHWQTSREQLHHAIVGNLLVLG